jgi:hypothetical protein
MVMGMGAAHGIHRLRSRGAHRVSANRAALLGIFLQLLYQAR